MTSPLQNIDQSWQEVLGNEFKKPYFKNLEDFLEKEYGKETIYPPKELIFNAFNTTPFKQVQVILLGQDPYHGAGQAHGLCFSVLKGIIPPRSLLNIFKELKTDLGIPGPSHGNLESWAKQGVLLLNTTLTVKAGKPLSHHHMGWEIFTDHVITELSQEKEGLVFLLWGRNAQVKEQLIDTTKHTILKAAHPSPFSAAHGFFGCKHFSKTNEILEKKGMKPIDWRIE
jgi:uracil-DNA glycosylase